MSTLPSSSFESTCVDIINAYSSQFQLYVLTYQIHAKDILQTVGSIAVQAMVFNDQERLDNEAAGQTLPSN